MILSLDQLSAAAERLGATLEDVQELFHTRISFPPPETETGPDLNRANVRTCIFRDDAINRALDDSLFAICEKAFSLSPSQQTVFSPGVSVSASPTPRNSLQQANDSLSPASASSSAAAVQRQTRASRRSAVTKISEEASHDPECGLTSDNSLELGEGTPSEAGSGAQSPELALARRGKEAETGASSKMPSPRSARDGSAPITPLSHLLAFANGQQLSLADLSGLDNHHAGQKIRSLSIIPGCAEYHQHSLFSYIEALFSAHLDFVKSLPENQDPLKTDDIDDLRSEMTEVSWATFYFDAAQSNTRETTDLIEKGSSPPMLRRCMEVFQFTNRLVEKMSGSSDLISRTFLDGLYSSKTPKLVASLADTLLSRWARQWHRKKSLQKKSFLLESCVRVLIDFIVYELSPTSQVRENSDISIEAFLVFQLGKDGLPALSGLIDYCYQFVTSDETETGKECRVALCELLQTYVVRCKCPCPVGSIQANLWKETGNNHDQYLNSWLQKETFWSIIVQPAVQQIKKDPKPSNSCFEFSFLASLLSHKAAKRALFHDKRSKVKWMLLNAVVRTLEVLSRDLLSYFRDVDGQRKSFPGIYTATDLIQTSLASAAVQREILSGDSATKCTFLASLESLITNSAKLVPCSLDVVESMPHARRGPFGRFEYAKLKRCEAPPECDDETSRVMRKEDQLNTADWEDARHRAVAFSAKIIGYIGKSLEDGSWDMSQMNSIKTLLSTRVNSSRARLRLWNEVYKVQRGVERKVGSQTSLSPSERNQFSMVVEVIRKHAVCESKDREAVSSQESVAGSRHISAASGSISVESSFPPVWDVPALQDSVCSQQGFVNLDDNHSFLSVMKNALVDEGQQMLARYDPESQFAIKWIRLQKRNAYIDRARELLDKADKTVGQPCSCVPGYPKDHGNRSESRVACANDLCENRHMKIECVPGKCGAGSYCMNQRMQNLEYAKFKMVPFPGKGVGIVADEDISEGALVGEYQGEVVSMDEYEKRVQEYEGERHFYFMTLTSKLVIDASRKSQATRFLNHSCDPNAETQKWNADGEPRVGIFANRPIQKGEEITFDYGARSLTQYSAKCLCGGKNCRGLLAVRQKDESGSAIQSHGDELRKSTTQETCKTLERKGHQLQLQDERRCTVVKEKIDTARRYLRDAEALSKQLKKDPPAQDCGNLNEEKQRKLNIWKQSLSLSAGGGFKGDQPLHPRTGSNFPRIPRRSILLRGNEGEALGSTSGEGGDRNQMSKGLTTSKDADNHTIKGKLPTSMATRRAVSASRWALFEESSAGKSTIDRTAQNPAKRPAETEGSRRFAKVPRTGFLPTSSKLKKQPVRPKFVKRKRTREPDGEDSMGEYSTASEAEPVLEEPATSPSRLPDGNGACSDDEFVAAPPVQYTHPSPTAKRWKHSGERRSYEERGRSRREFAHGDVQATDRSRFRLQPSHPRPVNKSETNLQWHFRPSHKSESPRRHDRNRPKILGQSEGDALRRKQKYACVPYPERDADRQGW